MTVQNQTKEACNERHWYVRWGFKISFASLSLLIILVGWAILAGNSAKGTSHKVYGQLRIHEAVQEQSDKDIQGSLRRIEQRLAKQQDMIEDLWRSNGGGS